MQGKYLTAMVIIVSAVIILSFKKNNEVAVTAGMFEPVAVLELFTSQGCSSCPPADKLLAETISETKKTGRKIYALSFHVDYWNRLGWADPFSNAAYSQRQKNYASILNLDGAYTPQMVVNGSSQFTGSDKYQLTQALNRALKTKASINFTALTASFTANKTINVQYATEGITMAGKINFALIALSETTLIERGENGGHSLQNENVVRQWITIKAAASGQVEFSNYPLPAKENIAVIAYFQQDNNLKITGAAMVKPD